jgi:hypothetical protein
MRLLGVAGSAGAVAGAAIAAEPGEEAEDRIATIEEMAALTFVDQGPAAEQVLGSFAEFVAQAKKEYPMLRLAAAATRQDDVKTFEAVQCLGPEAMTEFAESLFSLKDRYEGLAAVLNCAGLRTMAALSRHCVATGVEA